MSAAGRRAPQGGFTLIEVLVTLVILLLGLLGLVGLQAKAQVAETESYQRTQALVLLRDMADRISANRTVAAADSYLTGTLPTSSPVSSLGTGSTQACPPASPAATVAIDLCSWDAALKGAAETIGGNNVGAMLGARGCVTKIATNRFLVQVVWQGLATTAAPPASVTCGSGSYDTLDLTRRAVTTVVEIGTLDP